MARILIAGDFCPYDRTIDRDDSLQQVESIIRDADYAIVNLECAIVDEDSAGRPISKIGPNLSASRSCLSVIKQAGFSCVTLANNHFADFGHQSVLESLKNINKVGLDYVGGGENLVMAGKNLYKKIGGQTIAFISACENEFTIATKEQGGSNPLNPVKQFYAIKKAKEQADFVFLIIHGGAEDIQLPSPRMQELYRFFVDAGADVVINHHQHCYSGYEIYHNKAIFYGLGNFCFDWPKLRTSKWNEGYMVCYDTEKIEPTFEIIPYIQCAEDPIVLPMSLEKKKSFDSELKQLNDIISDSQKLETQYKANVLETSNELYRVLFPFHVGAKLRAKIIQSPKFKPFIRQKINYLRCESHRDRMLIVLNKLLQNN